MNDLAIYAVDVGSVARNRLGWARAYVRTGWVDPEREENDIRRLTVELAGDLRTGRPVALGFECPLYVPVPEDPIRLGAARAGEGNRAWSAGAGTGALATGLVEAAWILRELRRAVPDVNGHINWSQFKNAGSGLFLWEAFVSSTAKAKELSHHGDAAVAVRRFIELLPDPTTTDAVDAEAPLSLIAAALMWSGWTDNPTLIRQKCLVVKAVALPSTADGTTGTES